MGPHVLVEDVAASEVEHATVILILRDEPGESRGEKKYSNEYV